MLGIAGELASGDEQHELSNAAPLTRRMLDFSQPSNPIPSFLGWISRLRQQLLLQQQWELQH
jgi:hypothetical protein